MEKYLATAHLPSILTDLERRKGAVKTEPKQPILPSDLIKKTKKKKKHKEKKSKHKKKHKKHSKKKKRKRKETLSEEEASDQ